MFPYNYHTHTRRCGHASGDDEEYVLAAIKAGYKVLGFSDHAPYRNYPHKGSHMDIEDFAGYIESIHSLKEKYKEARDSKYVSKPISWALENLIPHEKRDEYRIISNEPEGA